MPYAYKLGLGEFKTQAEDLADKLEFMTALWSTRGIVEIDTGSFTIGHCTRNNGQCIPGQLWFEHNELGDECGGGLWFDGATLDDYDGTGCLPLEVGRFLRSLGIKVDDDCFGDLAPIA
jgi:hypothetical protein